MLAVLHSRCIRNGCTRIPLVNRPSTLVALVKASHPLPQSRFLHASWTSSIAREETQTKEGAFTTTPQIEPKERMTRSKKTSAPWSKDEIDRFDYLYSDGKNPTIRSILSLFPGRTRAALYRRGFLHRDPVHRKIWSSEEKARLLEMHSAGTTTFEILKYFPGRTEKAVIGKLNRSLPDSYFADRKRTVSSSVLGQGNREEGGNNSNDQEGGAIVTPVPVRRRLNYWTKEEDDTLRNLVQKAKERNPDRWTHEFSRILSDSKERNGLATTRSLDTCTRRWGRLETRPFVARNTWTEHEDDLLKKSVYSRLGIQLNSTSNTQFTTHLKIEDNNGLSQSNQPTGTLKINKKKEQWPEVSIEKLKALDWHQVALDVGSRDRDGCRVRFDTHFQLKRGQKWTEKETELLKEGLRMHGRDWAKVASVVGTRAATQVRKKYENLQAEVRTKGSQ